MNRLYPIEYNNFYRLVENVCFEVRLPFRFSNFSKTTYGNFVHVFLTVYKEKLNLSYRRFVEVCEENNLQRMLCIKRIPHYTTIQKFVQRINKTIFEKLVRACRKLLKLKNITAAIDGTGFSNTNPSHHYIKRINSKKPVKNYTKTVFLADINNNIILDVKTTSNHEHETLSFKPMIKQLAGCLKTVLADKGYDSMSNRKTCWKNNIEIQIPFREHEWTRKGYGHKPKYSAERRRALKKFDKTIYNKRALIESINSAIKQTLGGFVRARKAENQQKNVTIKALAYNIEHINRKLKIVLLIEFQ
jgi:transposase